jgi:hypothetical protein
MMLNIVAGVMVIIASFLHCWYGRNASATGRNALGAFYLYGKRALLISIALLISGLIIFWLSAGILVALAVAGVYFFVLPLIIMPILEKTGKDFFTRIWWGTSGAVLKRRLRANMFARLQAREKMTIMLSRKIGPGPESPLREFPLLYLYFDDFSELQNADKHGGFDVEIQSGSLGYDGFAGILADEERFLGLYRNDMLRLMLKDGTVLQRRFEVEYWDRILHPEKYARKPKDYPVHNNTQETSIERNMRELAESVAKGEDEANIIVRAIKVRDGLAER